ncbi:MAG TPA: head decoration protein [Rhizomicrobium sp.]
MQEFTEKSRSIEAVLRELPISRRKGILAASQTIAACSLLALVAVAASQQVGAATAIGVNAGNGAFGAVTADDNAPAGRYTIVFVEAEANAGRYVVYKPDGTEDGHGAIGAAYNGTINFNPADGANDFKAGDSFYVDVSYDPADQQYVAWDPDGADGSEVASAMSLYAYETGEGETLDIATIDRLADLNTNLIAWPDGADDDAKAAAAASLEKLKGIRLF